VGFEIICNFETCNKPFIGLLQQLWYYLTIHTHDIYIVLSALIHSRCDNVHVNLQGAPWPDEPVQNYYNEKWGEFSKGIIYVDRLFEPLTATPAKDKPKKVVDMDTVVNVRLSRIYLEGRLTLVLGGT
jgi:hypothetical protein